MRSLVVFAVFVAATFGATPYRHPRISKDLTIVGGEDAADGEFPHQVQLRSGSTGFSLFCGGSVINEEYVVTAAHCCRDQLPRNIHIVAGGTRRIEEDAGEEQKSDVSKITIHEDYDSSHTENDICLLHLKTKLEMTEWVQPVALPAQGELTEEGTDCIVTGWGTTSSGGATLPDKLQKVTVPVIGDTACRAKYGRLHPIADSEICAGTEEGGKDSCQGDSGGPMINAETKSLVGIVSWGIGCAEAKHPGVYTEVGYFVDWIHSKIGA